MASSMPGVVVATLVLVAWSAPAGATENCSDCMDDDGDGLIDCYDPDCLSDAAACPGSYLARSLPPPSCSPVLVLRELWRAPYYEWTPTVGDVDGDGMPEVIAHGVDGRQLVLLDGATGSVDRASATYPVAQLAGGIAIADVDRDGTAEIFLSQFTSPGTHSIERYEHDLSLTFASYVPWSTGGSTSSGVAFADFDGDGTPEVFNHGAIYDVRDGHLLLDVGAPLDTGTGRTTLAADVAPDDACAACAGPELVGADSVHAVDVASGTFELVATKAGPQVYGAQELADWDGDLRLDVVTDERDDSLGVAHLTVWNPRTGEVMGRVALPFSYSSTSPVVADFDGDGELEIALVIQPARNAGRVIRILDHDLSVLRDIPIEENSEWTTPMSFDFNADGVPELAFRGSTDVYILDTRTGSVLTSAPCPSPTSDERMTVVDVNADGQADLLAPCSDVSHELVAWTVEGSAPARQVVNQWQYDVVNINDDLSVPCRQQDKAAAGLPAFLNGSMRQAPLLDMGRTPAERCACPSPPIAAAGPDQAASPCDVVRLDGSASLPGDCANVVYRWSSADGWVRPFDPDPVATIAATRSTTFVLEARCADPPGCASSDSLDLTLVPVTPGPPVGPALRATGKSLASVDFDWSLARALLAQEHVHVRRATVAAGPFGLIAPVPHSTSFTPRRFTDTDAPNRLYFYLVSFATCDEQESE